MADTGTRSFLAYLGPETATLGLAAFKKIVNSKAFALMRNNGSATCAVLFILECGTIPNRSWTTTSRGTVLDRFGTVQNGSPTVYTCSGTVLSPSVNAL